jgi:SAM-dependent methyltransferase
MAKAVFDDYVKEIRFQRQVWREKPVLRRLYEHWYATMVASLAPLKPVIEIGSGCGNFKEYFPDAIATDVVAGGPWVDRVIDAHQLSFAAAEVGNLVAFDVIHHLQRPLDFLRQAAAALQPGGRLVLCEPAVTPWSRLVYRFHHETVDMNWPLYGLDGIPPDADDAHTFANMAIPEILFGRQRARTLKVVPSLRFVDARKFGFLLYPLTGGFGYRCLIPATGFAALLKVEDALLGPFANWLTGMRMLVVLEKEAPKS